MVFMYLFYFFQMFIYFYEEYGKKEPIAEGPGGTHLDLFYGAAITCASFFSSAAF